MLLCKETMKVSNGSPPEGNFCVWRQNWKLLSRTCTILALWQFLIGEVEQKWKSAVGRGAFDNKIVPPMDLALEASLENPSNRAVQYDTAPKGCARSSCISPSKRFSVFPPLHASRSSLLLNFHINICSVKLRATECKCCQKEWSARKLRTERELLNH